MGKSVMLTGAPVTGKTTVTRVLRDRHGYSPSPDYTTRPIRRDEVDGVDKHFVTVERFKNLFTDGRLIEATLDYCNYQGNYYGSPAEWLREQELGGDRVLTCVAVKIAGIIRDHNPGLVWVHLEADNSERADRLALRGASDMEIAKRLANSDGDSHVQPKDADLVINTSRMPLDSTVQTIMETMECRQAVI